MPESRLIEDEIERVVYALPEIVRSVTASRSSVAGKVTPPQLRALLPLAGGATLTMGELAARSGVSCAAATQVVDQLVALGLAERERSARDRRVVLVRVTEEARPELQRALARRRRQVAEVFARLDPTEQRAFARGLALLAEVLARDAAGGETPVERAAEVRA